MPRITIDKHNRLSEEKIASYLAIMRLPRPFFEPIYKCSIKSDPRANDL